MHLMRSRVVAVMLIYWIFTFCAWAKAQNVALFRPTTSISQINTHINSIHAAMWKTINSHIDFKCVDIEMIQKYSPPYNFLSAESLQSIYNGLSYVITITIAADNATCRIYFLDTRNECEFIFDKSLLNMENYTLFGQKLIDVLENRCLLPSPVQKEFVSYDSLTCEWFNTDERVLLWWNNCLSSEWRNALAYSYDIDTTKLIYEIQRIKNILNSNNLFISENCSVKDLEGCRNMTNLVKIDIKCRALEDFNGPECIRNLSLIVYSRHSPAATDNAIEVKKNRFEDARNQCNLFNMPHFIAE